MSYQNKKLKEITEDKSYFKRFLDLEIFSYTKPDSKSILIGADPKQCFELFHGNIDLTNRK